MRGVLAGSKSRAMSKSRRKLSVSSERNGRSALEPGGSASSRACAASRASPTTATSAGCQRPIWPRSESTWISGTLGSEWPKLMVRRLRPAPNTSTQSAWSIMRRAAECEKEPTMPRLAGWPRNMSLPRAEVTSRAPMRSASCSSSALAPARCAPRPATIRGLRLCRTRAAAASIACGRGAAGGRGGFGARGAAALARSMSASWTLTGSSRAAAPPCSAAAAASASAPRAVSGLVATKVRRPAAPSTPVELKPL